MLEVRSLTKLSSGIPAVTDISFCAPAGEVTGYLGPNGKLNDEHEVELLDQAMDRRVHVTQAHLAKLSTHGRQIILPNVGHGIPVAAPAAIVDAVRDVLWLR
jgi:ABC-type lipopolysaccharide export system ATPase subunit